MNNAELITSILEQAGVRWAFGIPSGPVLPLIEALRKSSIEYVLTASETSAGFMATAVGQLTGTPGVCVSTLGPGATNLATGVGCAWLDRAPLIAITCNVATPWLDRRIQMRIDHHALFQPLTKGTFPLRTGQIGATVHEALSLAHAEPPGPVHLDLPEDVAQARAEEDSAASTPYERYQPSSSFDGTAAAETVAAVAAALEQSRKPLLVTGLTFTRSRSREKVLEFVERQHLPFISTLHAKGFLPESNPNWAGVLGRARRTDVQRFIRQADLILAVGYDPIEINYEEWAGDTPVIHLSSEPSGAGPEVNMRYDAAGNLDRLIEGLAELPPIANEWSDEEWETHRQRFERALRPDWPALAPHHVLDVLREQMPADAILAYDVGAHNHQVASQWRADLPWTCLSTNGWSSMGCAMPMAYAAKLIHPGRAVVAVAGDGGFQMTVGELALARRLGLAVPVIVLNDGWLGLMKVKQERREYPLSGVFLGDPPESPSHYFGVPCRAARNERELRAAIDWALNLGGPSVIEAFVDAGPYSLTVYD